MTINETAQAAHENAKSKGFFDEPKNIGEMLCLIHSEVSEALECDRKGKYMFPKSDTFKTYPDDYEEWREIDGFEGEYEASNLGRVRSLDLQVWSGRVFYSKTGRILAPGKGKAGYNTVALRGKTYKVAVLVGRVFVAGWEDGFVINHINGNKEDDYANNLEWISSASNNKHALVSGLRVMTKKLTRWELCEVAALGKYGGKSAKEINALFPIVSISRIRSIVKNAENYLDVFEFELADIMIRVMDLAAFKGIDLEAHIAAKMRYNSLRPHKHGKKY